jgi:hypothetical protein
VPWLLRCLFVALLVVCNRDLTSFCVSVNVLNKLEILIGHYFIIRSSLTKNNRLKWLEREVDHSLRTSAKGKEIPHTSSCCSRRTKLVKHNDNFTFKKKKLERTVCPLTGNFWPKICCVLVDTGCHTTVCTELHYYSVLQNGGRRYVLCVTLNNVWYWRVLKYLCKFMCCNITCFNICMYYIYDYEHSVVNSSPANRMFMRKGLWACDANYWSLLVFQVVRTRTEYGPFHYVLW